MRVLLVSSFLPYPLYSGGHVRLFNLIKELSVTNKITLICEKRPNQTQNDIDEVKKFCEDVITVDRKKQWAMENIVKTAFSTFPFLLIGHTLPEMKQAIVQELNQKKFDVIHVETFYVYQNLPKTYLPTVLVEHNIEYQVYQRFVEKAPVMVRPLLTLDIEKIKHWEKKYWREATKLVAVSEKERSQMGRTDSVVVSNGVDLSSFPFKKKLFPKKGKTILFMGDFKWIQNRDSAKLILQKIWPEVIRLNPDISLTLWIVGKNIPDFLKALGDKSVVFDEHAPDITAKIYAKADILLSPIRVGGGTSYKILEAMASGVPVVTTPLGVDGLGATKDVDASVGETPEALAKNVSELLQNTDYAEKIRKNARVLIEKKYSWEKIAKVLEGVYEDARDKE
ncbi:MAG TPA: glycosyltransferase family 4 protein [Candidatus Saccharimonadales bacterium]|nr:glycosyltransferase family 4 protein [Candidatus Saccharimonadales bacterium]